MSQSGGGEPAGLLGRTALRQWEREQRSSLCLYLCGDMEKILLGAQHESGRSSSKNSHCDSPPRSQTPQDTNRAEIDTHSFGEKNSTLSEEDYIERRREVESILKKKTQIGYGIGQVSQKIFLPRSSFLNTRSTQLLSA